MTPTTLPVTQPPPPPPPPPQHHSLLPSLFLDTRRRIVFFILCSPLLLPLLCLSFPLLCIAHLVRRFHSGRKDDGGWPRRCEEGRGRQGDGDVEERDIGWILLQRYLEDQLGLVGSDLGCADQDCTNSYLDHDHDRDGGAVDESRRPLLM